MSSQSRAINVLLTRPADQSARFAQLLTDRFGAQVHTVISPLIAPVFLRPPIPQAGFGAVVFTSETGVHAARDLGQPLPSLAFCVGDHTAQVAQSAGFAAQSASGDATALVARLQENRQHAPFLYCRGRDARIDLVAELGQRDILAQEVVVYAHDACAPNAQANALLAGDQMVIIPVFSPRTAQYLAAHLCDHPANAPLALVSISAAVDRELAGISAKYRKISAHPDAKAVLDAIGTLI